MFFAIVDGLLSGLLSCLEGLRLVLMVVFGVFGALGLLNLDSGRNFCVECLLIAAGSGVIFGILWLLGYIGPRSYGVWGATRRNRYRNEWQIADEPFAKLDWEIQSLKDDLQNAETEEATAAQTIRECQVELSRCVWTEGEVDSK